MTEATRKSLSGHINGLLGLVDNLVLGAVALGTMGIVGALLADMVMDILRDDTLSLMHLLGEMMFVLIVMELFRQIVRQISRHAFSLKPFMAIGVIASIRGLLMLQMKLGSGEIDWVAGSVGILALAATVLVLLAAYYLYQKLGEGERRCCL